MDIVKCILIVIIVLLIVYIFLKRKAKENERVLRYELNNLKKRERELLNIISDRNKIISIFYHHIKGPLNFLEILMEEIIEKSERLKYKEIDKDLHLLHKTISDSYQMTREVLLWVKSVIYTKSDLQKQNLNKIAEEIVLQYKGFSKSIEVELRYNPSDYHVIITRKGVVEIILSNLLSNALRYAEKKVQIEIVSISANQIKLTVKDDGGGITDSTLLEKLNEGEVESFNLNRSDEYGTGIGLILVRGLARENELQICFKNYSNGLGVEIIFNTG